MEKINLGNHEVVKRNYEYLLKAKEYGFFQNGWDPEDIASCDDWIITWWIDEIGDIKKDQNKFINEVLPTFKRWFSNGINAVGVGRYYDFLKLAELNGIKIDSEFFECVSEFDYVEQSFQKKTSISNNSQNNSTNNNYENLLNHFNSINIIKDFKRWQENGVPLMSKTGELYDTFLSLENTGEIIDFDTFIFFYTLKTQNPSSWPQDFQDKKELEQEYKIKIFNGDEFLRLQNWVTYIGGYNQQVITELRKSIKKEEEIIFKKPGVNLFSQKANKYLNKNISVNFITINENGEETKHNLKGTLIDYTENSVTISYLDQQSGEQKKLVIEDNNQTSIQSIYLANQLLYMGHSVNNKLRIQKNLLKIKKLEQRDIVSEYVKKYGTIKGLAYLKYHASRFINCVTPNIFPINNLFAYCFENIANVKSSTDENILQLTMYVYNEICSGELSSIKNANFGYQIEDFLSEYCLEKIKQYCYYVATTIKKEALPPFPYDISSTSKPLETILEDDIQSNVIPIDPERRGR